MESKDSSKLMKKVIVHTNNLPNSTYPVFIGSSLLRNIKQLAAFRKYSKVVFVIDESVWPLVKPLQDIIKPDGIIKFKFSEKKKNLDTAQHIWSEMLKIGCDRKSLLINIGGGVTCDIAGFAASTYMRGIEFIQVPTTLLSQVDASVGGKVGVNFAKVKNLIGSFQQPSAVIVDIGALRLLPERHLVSGFAEIIKHGLIADAAYFQQVISKKPTDFSNVELIDIIEQSITIKKNVIENDPAEQGERKLLNLGHTIGHAVEVLSQETAKPLLHGEAVSIGITEEAKLSAAAGILPENQVQIITDALTHAGLPVNIPAIDRKAILQKMLADKKNISGSIRWTLLKKIGQAIYNKEINSNIIEKVLLETPLQTTNVNKTSGIN